MKRQFILLAAAVVAVAANGQTTKDSLRQADLEEVVVKAVRVQKDAPFAVSNIKKSTLQSFSKSGQELPFLFSRTPGVLAWSENGVGTGTTYMRIRGAAGSRINVTLDGVALNSPEDQTVFWANMNSYAALLGSVQIQRGVGSSTNGDGAFGGSISLATAAPSYTPTFELTGSYGSYNTYNVGASFSTGLLGNHWIFNGAYHETATDGFIHGTNGRSGSYLGALTYYGDNFTLSYKNIGNFEKTGQAWSGITAGNDDATLMGSEIRTYRDMWNHGLGRYNSLYEHLVFDDNAWEFPKDARGNYMTQRYVLDNGTLWDRTTDNFHQDHNILSFVWHPSTHWTHTAALHYTYGHGYYKEFRYNDKFSKFGLTATDAEGNTVKRDDFIRRKGLTQHAYGLVYNADYKGRGYEILGGVNLQQFRGGHYGYLDYIANASRYNISRPSTWAGTNKYYDSHAHKYDYSAFVKANVNITKWWDAFVDLQYRHVDYTTDGVNDKFIDNPNGNGYINQTLDIDKSYNFFNPKAGLSFHFGGHKFYVSEALANREPERNNFTDNGSYPAPKAERLYDTELGYEYTGQSWRVALNLYYMRYHNQFVQTGQQSDIGENLTTNIDKSYRMGAELSAGWDPTPWLTLEGNAALSRNKVKDFTEYIENWNGDAVQVHYDNSTLSFSPAAILNGDINFHINGFEAAWHTNFVSRQYLDNTESKLRSLPCYSQTDLLFGYTAKTKVHTLGIKEVVLGLNFNNIFGRRYAASGWVYSAVSESSGYTPDNRYYQIGFIPMAGFTCMTNITLRF